MELVLEAGHTHLYPGHAGVVGGEVQPGNGTLPCSVAFSDGVVVLGTLSPLRGAHWRLDVGPYLTAAGTAIAARRWQIAISERSNGRSAFRVEKKLPANKDGGAPGRPRSRARRS